MEHLLLHMTFSTSCVLFFVRITRHVWFPSKYAAVCIRFSQQHILVRVMIDSLHLDTTARSVQPTQHVDQDIHQQPMDFVSFHFCAAFGWRFRKQKILVTPTSFIVCSRARKWPTLANPFLLCCVVVGVGGGYWFGPPSADLPPRPALRRTAQNFACFFRLPPPFSLFLSLTVSYR